MRKVYLRNFEDSSILIIASLMSESLLGNTPVNDNSPKVSGYLSNFLYLVLLFNVSHVKLLHIHVSACPINDCSCGLCYTSCLRKQLDSQFQLMLC